MKRALITGVSGQDGTYLSKLLLEKGYEVWGGCGPEYSAESWRLGELGLEPAIRLVPCDLTDPTSVRQMVEEAEPDEIYNLAARSAVAGSFHHPMETAEVNATGVLRLLEVVRTVNPEARVFQASSCEMYGNPTHSPQDETTPFRPHNPYGVSKLFAHGMIDTYRRSHGLFACAGILFNHESPLRTADFVTRKISDGVARIKLGLLDQLALGNLDARRDWGYAPDYVEAMWLMLQQNAADDYLIASGQAHTVRQFVETAFRAAGMEVAFQGRGMEERGLARRTGKVVVEVSPEFFRPEAGDTLAGNATKARQQLGWQPKVKFEELVRLMVEADLKRLNV